MPKSRYSDAVPRCDGRHRSETDLRGSCWLICMRRTLKTHVPAIAPAARARSLTVQTAQKAKQAKLELLVIVPLMAITVLAYVKREQLFGADAPVRVGAAVAMVALGWMLARDLGRFAAPALFRRMDPATA
jgi:hypothetical protein